MTEGHETRPPMLTILEAIAYFLAGNLAISTAAEIQASGEITITNLLTFTLGIILVLAGLAYLISTFRFLVRLARRIWGELLLKRPRLARRLTTSVAFTYVKNKLIQLRSLSNVILVAFLFLVTATQVATVLLNYYSAHATPLLIISTIFLILITISIFYTSRQFFTNLAQLLQMILILGVLGIFTLFRENFASEQIELFSINFSSGKLQLLFILAFIAFLTLCAIRAFSKQRVRQLRLKL